MNDEELRDKLANEYHGNVRGSWAEDFKAGWDAARANPQLIKDAVNMLNIIEELTKKVKKLEDERLNSSLFLKSQREAYHSAIKERDELKAKLKVAVEALRQIEQTRCAWQLSQDIAFEALEQIGDVE
jgi:hypothetical protein